MRKITLSRRTQCAKLKRVYVAISSEQFISPLKYFPSSFSKEIAAQCGRDY